MDLLLNAILHDRSGVDMPWICRSQKKTRKSIIHKWSNTPESIDLKKTPKIRCTTWSVMGKVEKSGSSLVQISFRETWVEPEQKESSKALMAKTFFYSVDCNKNRRRNNRGATIKPCGIHYSLYYFFSSERSCTRTSNGNLSFLFLAFHFTQSGLYSGDHGGSKIVTI